ncbi:hypothetical protein LEP1GSC161_1960 [Leptospira santarosai str. CBC1416]|uniref:Uncharacterized protein n=1 Tax=Leptospira santarosai str. CBC1416 TaxID=1193059 RepID=M6VN40_9LEPT|nr:hypothetical protein LEP1GSC161_1960 [Leptospira santarosai str. CBC1416]
MESARDESLCDEPETSPVPRFSLDILHSEKLKREPPKTIRNRFGGRVVDRITTFFTFSILRLICVIRLMSQ